MNSEDRFLVELARRLHDQFIEHGHVLFFDDLLNDVAATTKTADHEALHVIGKLEDAFLIVRNGGHWDGRPLALYYEQELDRAEFLRQNIVRRKLLQAAARTFEEQTPAERLVNDGSTRPFGHDHREVYVAAKALELMGFLDLREAMGMSIAPSITTSGYEVARDSARLAAELPVDASEDVSAHAPVAADALGELITSCSQLLRQRGWEDAAAELAEGDRQHAEGHWADAVGRYYAALESGLKYRLREESVVFGDNDALKALARVAVAAGIIPANYQELFGFANSIRSPRSHGGGGGATPVPIGPAECLLLANHARSLLVYLGHRPRLAAATVPAET